MTAMSSRMKLAPGSSLKLKVTEGSLPSPQRAGIRGDRQSGCYCINNNIFISS